MCGCENGQVVVRKSDTGFPDFKDDVQDHIADRRRIGI